MKYEIVCSFEVNRTLSLACIATSKDRAKTEQRPSKERVFLELQQRGWQQSSSTYDWELSPSSLTISQGPGLFLWKWRRSSLGSGPSTVVESAIAQNQKPTLTQWLMTVLELVSGSGRAPFFRFLFLSLILHCCPLSLNLCITIIWKLEKNWNFPC